MCNSLVDPFGDHQVGCGGNGDRIHRHDSLQQLTVVGASTTKGHALSVGEERKRAAAEACHSVGVSFIPLVIESLGADMQ